MNPVSASCIDGECLKELAKSHRVIVTLEDGILSGGWGQTIASFFGAESGVKVINRGYKKEFLDRFKADDVLLDNRLTPELIASDAAAAL